jgi:hypothetical protein
MSTLQHPPEGGCVGLCLRETRPCGEPVIPTGPLRFLRARECGARDGNELAPPTIRGISPAPAYYFSRSP